MDRSQPTDPPEGPVNRIKQYLDLEELLKQHEAGSEPSLTEVAAAPEVSHPVSVFFQGKEADPTQLNHLLGKLSTLYEKDPHNPKAVKLIALTYLMKGDLENALAYLEWYEQIAPSGDLDTSTLALIEDLRKRLNPPS